MIHTFEMSFHIRIFGLDGISSRCNLFPFSASHWTETNCSDMRFRTSSYPDWKYYIPVKNLFEEFRTGSKYIKNLWTFRVKALLVNACFDHHFALLSVTRVVLLRLCTSEIGSDPRPVGRTVFLTIPAGRVCQF